MRICVRNDRSNMMVTGVAPFSHVRCYLRVMPLSTAAVDCWDAEAAHELLWQIDQPNVHKKASTPSSSIGAGLGEREGETPSRHSTIDLNQTTRVR